MITTFISLLLFFERALADLGDNVQAVISKDNAWLEIKHDPSLLDHRPPPPDDSYLSSDSVIFVSLASLHDWRCGRTLHDFFAKAEHPERIIAGVVTQNKPSTKDCIDVMCSLFQGNTKDDKPDPNLPCPHKDQVRIIRLSHSEARGPNVARALAQTMMEDIPPNSYCLTVDAHSFGMEKWDSEILKEWGSADNEMAVLTTYVGTPSLVGKNVAGRKEVPHLCQGAFDGEFPRNIRATAAHWLKKPILAPLWGAGLSFSKCHAEINSPYDPHLKQIWTGEEYGRGARFWTRGYDLYTPTRPIIAHDYDPIDDQKGWTHDRKELKSSTVRLKSILRYPDGRKDENYLSELGKYDLGMERDLSDYAHFCGVDTQKQIVYHDYCIDYEWVPWNWREEVLNSYRKLTWKNDEPMHEPYLSRIERYDEGAYDFPGVKKEKEEIARIQTPNIKKVMAKPLQKASEQSDEEIIPILSMPPNSGRILIGPIPWIIFFIILCSGFTIVIAHHAKKGRRERKKD